MTNKDREIFCYIIIGLTVILICAIGSVGVSKLIHNKWNSGNCKCGGTWVYQGYEMTGRRHNIPTYIYECNSCDGLLLSDFHRLDN